MHVEISIEIVVNRIWHCSKVIKLLVKSEKKLSFNTEKNNESIS